jgi:MFS family permease
MTTTAYPSLARARFAQVALAALGLFGAMDVGLVGLLLEPIKQELGLTDVEVGLSYTTAFYAAYGLLAVPMGMLADRVSRVRMLSVAVLLWLGGLALTGLSHGVGLLVVSKLIMGIASAITYPAAMSLMADYFAPERRAMATTSYPLGQTLGQVSALLVGGLGYTALVALAARDPHALGGLAPWRAVFLIFAAFGLLLLVPPVFALREPARHERREGGGGSFAELWAYRGFLVPLFLAMMALCGSSTALQAWSAPALIRLYGLRPGDFAWASSIATLAGGIAATLLSGRVFNLARKQGGTRRSMQAAGVAAALCAPASFLAVMPNLWAFALLGLLAIIGGGVAIAVPVIAINFRLPNEVRGRAMGLYVVLVAVAGMIGAPLAGYVGQRLGGNAMLGWGMAAVGAPFSLLAALSFWIASRSRTTASDHALPVFEGA